MKVLLLTLVITLGSDSVADSNTATRIENMIRSELSSRFRGATVTVDIKALQKITIKEASSVARVHHIQNNGNLLCSVGSQFFEVPVSVRQSVWMPTRRIERNEELKESDFVRSQVDLELEKYASKREHLYLEQKLSRLRSRQTLLPNEPLLDSAVEVIPDVERGESVQVVIKSGLLRLETPARIEQEARIGDIVRVMTKQSKRILEGKLQHNRTVEVSL